MAMLSRQKGGLSDGSIYTISVFVYGQTLDGAPVGVPYEVGGAS